MLNRRIRMILGIDLAGSEKRPTGICVLNEKMEIIEVKTLFKDEEIIEIAKKIKPKIIAIDAPLSLPKGRKGLKKRSNIHFRKCDKELRKFGIKFFPITLGPMRKLTERGIKLKKKLEGVGFKVIEVYPGGAQDLLGIPRKQKGLEKLASGLKKLGIKGLKYKNEHELDAITAAYVGLLFLKGDYIALGDKDEGQIIMPKPYFSKN